MTSPNIIRPRLIANFLLLAIVVFCFGTAAYAKPATLAVKPEAATKSTLAPCLLTASPLTPHFNSGGAETFQLQVNVLGPGCTWSAGSDAQWLDVHPSSGSTLQTVFVDVLANLGSPRSSTIRIRAWQNLQPTGAEFTIGVTQGTLVCSYSFSPGSASYDFSAHGVSGTSLWTDVIASNPQCPRAVTTTANWITINSGSNLSGSGSIGYSIAQNNGSARTGQIKLGNAAFTISQEAAPCSYSTLSPSSKNFDGGGGTGAINVTMTSPNCSRSATSSVNWITIIGGNNSTGSGPLTYSVAPNSGSPRVGQIKLNAGPAAVTITQDAGQAANCTYTLSPSIFNFQPGNGSSSIVVTASSASCQWTPTSNAAWVKIINPGQRTGTGTINFTTDPNPGAARTAKITVGNKTATINQSANSNCTFTISPGSSQVGASGSEVNVNVTASNFCAWTASSQSPFISVTSGNTGAGNGTVKLKVLANAGASRSGTVTIAGKTILVIQDGTTGTAAMWISSLSPAFASVGGKEFQMTVKGANFANGCKVRWGGEERPTTFVNSSTLIATIPADDIADEGEFDITVSKTNGADETNAEQFMVYGAVANVSSASFVGGALAPASLVSAFGVDLATNLKLADQFPLPTDLIGTTVTIKDFTGKEHKAPMFFVSPGQINYLMPANVALGQAEVTVESGSGHVSMATVEIKQVAPALFTANSSGQGVATAQALRVKQNGQQVYEPVAEFNAGQSAFVAKPIDLTQPGETLYLILYGTGLRYRSSPAAVSVEIGGVLVGVLYAGATPGLDGLDQVNLQLPNNLAGRGEVDLVLTVDGKKANTVKLKFK